MKILVACEFSQTVTKAFRAKGHEAYSCDLLDTEGNPDWHIKDDVLNHLNDGWDMMIAHPSCQFLTNSGVRWLYSPDGSFNDSRWNNMRVGAAFFNELLNAPIPRICIENPIPHKYALELIGRKYDQIVQPWWFGDPYSKSTCLWLKNLPKLKPTNPTNERDDRIHKASPGPDRWKLRSRTPQGFANAVADQWSNL